jgi:hypothetical protein
MLKLTLIFPLGKMAGDASTLSTPGAPLEATVATSLTEPLNPSPATVLTIRLTGGALPPSSVMVRSTLMLIG